MNYFHLEAKVVSRGAGRSVIAAAAYASCSRLYNDYDGLTHDYTRKHGCLYSEVFLPQYAPEEWKDRQLLWEAVESVEKTKDSRLARELVVALPSELSLDDWKGMLERFIREQGTELGMCADVNIHDPSRKGWAFCLSSIYFSFTASYRCFQIDADFSAEASFSFKRLLSVLVIMPLTA